MAEEDKKVTIGLAIAAGLTGLAVALTLYALARAAPGPPEPPPGTEPPPVEPPPPTGPLSNITWTVANWKLRDLLDIGVKRVTKVEVSLDANGGGYGMRTPQDIIKYMEPYLDTYLLPPNDLYRIEARMSVIKSTGAYVDSVSLPLNKWLTLEGGKSWVFSVDSGQYQEWYLELSVRYVGTLTSISKTIRVEIGSEYGIIVDT